MLYSSYCNCVGEASTTCTATNDHDINESIQEPAADTRTVT